MTQALAAPETTDPERSENDARKLDRSLVHGIAWTGGMRTAAQLLRWGATLLLARILSPADYGLVGLAMVYLGLVSLVNEFGLSAAIVQQRNLTREQVSKLGGLSAALGFGFFGLTVALSPLIALFFKEPRVQAIVIILATTFVIRGFQVLPRALMTRDLEFKRLAWVDGVDATALAAGTLVLALLGFGYWALVFGSIVGATCSTVLALAWKRHGLAFPRQLGTIRSAVTYGAHVAASRVTWYMYTNADFAVVGRMLGAAALGTYSFGWTIANLPVERVSAIVGKVNAGIFASAQDDHATIRRYLLTITEGLAIVTFPIAIGLALVAREFVLVVLGSAWEAAIVPMALLVFYSGFRSITLLFPQVLVAIGEARKNMHFSIVAVVVLPLLFVLGSRWGTTGVAFAWIIGFPIVFLPFTMRYTLRRVGLGWREYLKSLWPALSSSTVMAAVVIAIRLAIPASDEPSAMLVRLIAMVAGGVLSYSAVLLTLHRSRLTTFLAFVRAARK